MLFQFFFLFSHNFHYLLLNTLPDDAFYYFQIARDIVTGYGSTFDKVHITNGYHPLWMLIILPIFKIFSVGGTYDITPIYAVLTLSLVLSACTGFVLSKIFRRFTDNVYIIAFGLVFWFFNPYNLYAVLNGLETSLTLLLLAVFSLALMNLKDAECKIAPYVWTGVFGGLLILARLDTIFIVFFGFLYMAYLLFRKDDSRNKANIKPFVGAALGTVLFYLPWQIWNYVTYGMLFTSASITGTYVHHQLTYFDNGGKSLGLILKTMVYMFDRAFAQFASNTGAMYVVFAFFGIALYFFAKNFNGFLDKLKTRTLSPLWFISLGLIVQMTISASVRWLFRDWYFIPVLFIVQFVLIYVCVELQKEFKNFQYILGIITIITLGLFYISFDKDLDRREIMQDTLYSSVVWQNENLPKGSKIGSFNAGIQGYFTAHKLVNLDGLVNNLASQHMLSGELWKYIVNVEKLDYISDFPKYITYKYSHFFGPGMVGNDVVMKLQPVHTTESNGNVMQVWKVPKVK